MVENQPIWCTTSSGLQASAATAARAARAASGLRTAHLLRTRAAQQGLHLARPSRLSGDEDPKLVVGEARVVGDRPEAPCGEQRIEQDAENGRERAEQDRHLEHDHDIRRDRADRLAAEHQRSEKHTSELQSLAYFVFPLLLEKKKKDTENTCEDSLARAM